MGKYTRNLSEISYITGDVLLVSSEEATDDLYQTSLNTFTQNTELLIVNNTGFIVALGIATTGASDNELVLSNTNDYHALTVGTCLSFITGSFCVEEKKGLNKIIVYPTPEAMFELGFAYAYPYLTSLKNSGLASNYINNAFSKFSSDVEVETIYSDNFIIENRITIYDGLTILEGGLFSDQLQIQDDIYCLGNVTSNSQVLSNNIDVNSIITKDLHNGRVLAPDTGEAIDEIKIFDSSGENINFYIDSIGVPREPNKESFKAVLSTDQYVASGVTEKIKFNIIPYPPFNISWDNTNNFKNSLNLYQHLGEDQFYYSSGNETNGLFLISVRILFAPNNVWAFGDSVKVFIDMIPNLYRDLGGLTNIFSTFVPIPYGSTGIDITIKYITYLTYEVLLIPWIKNNTSTTKIVSKSGTFWSVTRLY